MVAPHQSTLARVVLVNVKRLSWMSFLVEKGRFFFRTMPFGAEGDVSSRSLILVNTECNSMSTLVLVCIAWLDSIGWLRAGVLTVLGARFDIHEITYVSAINKSHHPSPTSLPNLPSFHHGVDLGHRSFLFLPSLFSQKGARFCREHIGFLNSVLVKNSSSLQTKKETLRYSR